MFNVITYDDGIKNIHESYHPTFKRILDIYIQNDEKIFFVAEVSETSQYRENFGNRKWRRSSHSCIVVITNYRWIRAGMNWSGMADSIPYRKIGSRIRSWFGEEYFTHNWAFPPKRLPNARELGKKELHERIGEYVIEVPLNKMSRILNRNNYKLEYKNQVMEIVEITFESRWIAFRAVDGNNAYDLLQLAIKNDDNIPVLPINRNGELSGITLEQLRELKLLLEEKLITELDYETKKKELLSKL